MLPTSDIDTQIRYKWFRSLKTSSSILAITLPRILATVAKLSEILPFNMSDASGSANDPLASPTASVAPTAGTSDSDAQTPVTFTKQMQQELTDKFLSNDEDRRNLNRKLTELHTSTTANSVMLHGLPGLIDSKLTSHHQSLTRLVDETIDDFIGEATNYMDERAPAPAAAALGPPFQFGPQAPSGLTRSFALAARAPPADATRMRSPISRTPAVPASVIHSDADINSKRAAFALSHH